MITIGNVSSGSRSGGSGSITASITVTSSGNALIVGAAQIDTAITSPSSVTGVAGVTFTKVSEGIAVAENGYPSYQGSPTIWLATNVPAGTYTISANYIGSVNVNGTITVVEVSPTSYASQQINSGNGTTLTTGTISVPDNSITFSCFHISPDNPAIGFSTESAGWIRHGIQSNGSSYTGFLLESNSQTASTSISETVTITAAAAPWSVANVILLDASLIARPALINSGGIISQMTSSDSVSAPMNAHHGNFIGLSDDDHPQYHNQSRGDARYDQIGHSHSVSSIQQSSANIGDTIAWNGTEWVVTTPSPGISLTKFVVSNQSYSTTSLTDISDLAIPMLANGVYLIDCIVTFQSAATTTGLNLGIITPSGCSNKVEIIVSLSQNSAAVTKLRIFMPRSTVALNLGNVVGTGVLAIDSNHSARITGVIENGATAGNCKIQFASEVNGSAVTVQSGSYLNLIRVA